MATNVLAPPEHRTAASHGPSSPGYQPPPTGRDGPSPTTRDDLELVAAYVAGDQLAFRTWLKRHEGRVYATCYRYFGDPRDAEDATQDTLIALARHAATVRGTAKLSTWLHRVATNACHDIARRQARRPRPSHKEAPDTAEAFDPVAYRGTELDLQAALARLDATSRTALILVAIEDRSYAEAAEIVGMSVPAIKSRIHRARAQLADILAAAA